MFTSPAPFTRMRSGGRLLGIFALTILLPGGLLAALGVRALIQERAAASVEVEKRLDQAAELAGRAVEHELTSWQTATSRLADTAEFGASLLPESLRPAATEPGALALVSFGANGPDVWPAGQLLYAVGRTVVPSSIPESPSAALVVAETAELRDKNYVVAASLYEEALKTATTAERPRVLLRLAWTYRKAGRRNEALARFRELQRFTQPIGALPSDLIAAYEVCSFSAAPVDPDRLAPCARGLYQDLVNGRWRLEPSRYLFYAGSARQWLQQAVPSDTAIDALGNIEALKLALTEAVASLVEAASDSASARAPSATTTIAATPSHLVATWRDQAPSIPHLRAVVISKSWLDTRVWPATLAGTTADDGLRVEIAGVDEGVLFRLGEPPDAGREPRVPMASFAVADMRVPIRVRVWPGDPAALTAGLARRQAYFVGVLGLVILVMAFGAYFTVRVVRQELAIAQLKSDFVSAVSHEFRSPLTGIRQLGEMLLRGRVTSDERRQEYYARITRESDRLSRLVENLLDFSRMDAGRREYRMERIRRRAVAPVRDVRVPGEVPRWCPRRADLRCPCLSPTSMPIGRPSIARFRTCWTTR